MASSSDEKEAKTVAAGSQQESSSSSEEDLVQPPPLRRVHTAEGSFEEGRKVRIGPQFQIDLQPWTEASDSLPPGGADPTAARDKCVWKPGSLDDSLGVFCGNPSLQMLMSLQ